MRRLCVAVLWLIPGLALANCWLEAGSRYGVDPWLLYSMAKKESNLRPNAISKDWDGSYGIGLMQINSKHLPTLARYGVTEEALFDPCTNINVGAWVLSWNIHRHGNNVFALGAYNAGTKRTPRQEERRRRYADDVLSIYQSEVTKAGALQR